MKIVDFTEVIDHRREDVLEGEPRSCISSAFFACCEISGKTALDLYCVGLQRPFLDFWRNLPDSAFSQHFTRDSPFSPKVIFDPPKMHSIFR